MLISNSTRKRNSQSGYSLLMVVFLVATSLILSAAVTPNVLTQGRRDREEETVWRGEQYKRAIGMYFRKFGRYPTKIEDLTKQTNGIRFLRQAYTDPLNKEDGSWRFIYVGPSGQLIGSERNVSVLQSVLSTATVPGGSPSGGRTQSSAAPGQTTGPGAPGVGQTGQQTAGGLAPNPLQSQPQPLSGEVVGGNIIGVGSKIKQSSLRVYEGEDNYEKWEFVWNPSQQIALPGQQTPGGPAVPQPPQQAQPGQQVPTVNPPSAGPVVR